MSDPEEDGRGPGGERESPASQRDAVVPGLRSEEPPREPKGRGDVWTEEREARNERRSDEGRHRLPSGPEASGSLSTSEGATREGAAPQAAQRRAGKQSIIEVNGVSLYVEDHGEGTPVLLIHGWPDSAHLWRHQIPFLTRHGFRAIAPDMRGFGRSSRPPEVADYALGNAVGDMAGILDTLGIEAAHVVGHDWGAAVAWLTATFLPDRVSKLVVLSVGHPRAPRTLRQDEMAWYQLFFQFEGIAEATLQYNDWAWLRRFSRGDGDTERVLEDLSRPGALAAGLNWYRANLAPRMPGTAPELPPVTVPTLGIWSTNDHYLDGERMEKSGACVNAPWRYEVIEGASHWIPLDAPDRLNELLLDWLRS